MIRETCCHKKCFYDYHPSLLSSFLPSFAKTQIPAGMVAFVVCCFAFYGIDATLCNVNRLTRDCYYEYIINQCQA